MSQPSVDHTKLLALDAEPKQNSTRRPLDITQKQDKINKKTKEKRNEYFTRTYSSCNPHKHTRNAHTKFKILRKKKQK
jgi:hypothetical protein